MLSTPVCLTMTVLVDSLDIGSYTELFRHRRDILVSMCKARALPTVGTKAVLVDLLLDWVEQQHQKADLGEFWCLPCRVIGSSREYSATVNLDTISIVDLGQVNHNELVAMCKRRHLDFEGTSRDLAETLLRARGRLEVTDNKRTAEKAGLEDSALEGKRSRAEDVLLVGVKLV
jgi:hypothetical protein